MSFSIRRLGADDAANYRAIRLKGLSEEPTAFASNYEREVGRSPDEWASQLQRSFAVGAFSDDALVGIASMASDGLVKTAHRGFIVGVYVTPDQRGRGVGKALLEGLIDGARGKVLQLHLTVTGENATAFRLYERLGFKTYGTVPRALRVDGRFHDEHLMVLRLDEGGKKVTDNE